MKKMKKINLLFLMLGLVSLTFLSSCGEDDGSELSPILTITPSGSLQLIEGEEFTVEVVAGENPTSKKRLETLTVVSDGGVNETITIQAATYSSSLTFTVPPARTAAYSFTFTVTDRDGLTAVRTLSVTSVEEAPLETPLSAPASFQWQRVGGTTSSSADLALFGLTWSSNSTTNAIIASGPSVKLVQFNAAEWNNITTVEELEAAVDAATAITQYTGVSSQASNTYNDVIATKNGSTYYLINVLTGTVTTGTAGTTITVTGNYKN
jgi:hypothetical protein